MAMPHRVFGLAVKFPVFVLILLFAVIWGLAYYVNVVLKRDLEHLLSVQQFSTVSIIAASIDQQIHLRTQALSHLAQAVGKQNLLGAPEQLAEFLRDNLTVETLFNGGLLIVNADGIGLADTLQGSKRIGQSLADWDCFRTALERRGVAVSTLMVDKVSGRPVVAISSPINDAVGKVIGVLAGITYLDTENFIDQIVSTYGDQHGGVLIIDRRGGRFVAATDATRVLQPIPAPGVNPIHDRYMSGYEGSGITVSSRGIEELTSSRRIATADWFAVVVLPVAAAFAPVTALQNTILGAALFLSIVVPGLVTPVVRAWLGPLRKITLALREMTTGRRALEALPVTTHDEVGQLIESFNQLQARVSEDEHLLREHRSRLETALKTARMQFIEWSITAQESIPEPLLTLVHRDERGRVATIVERDIASQEGFLVEFRGCCANAKVWLMARGRVVDPTAASRQAIAIVWDITELKLAELALLDSEERYRTLLELSSDAIFVHRDGVMVMANRSALRLFGAEREEQLLGLPWSARVHPDFHEAVRQRFQTLQQTNGQLAVPAMEQRYLRVDGAPVEVEVATSSIPFTKGRAVLSIARDITRRKDDDLRLKTLLVQQEALLDNALVGIVLLRQGVLIQCNRRFEELFGYAEGEMLGQRTDILYPTAEFYEAISERVYGVLIRGGTYIEELWFKRKDGSLFWGCLSGKALDSRQPLVGSVWICTDLTEQRHAQEHMRLVASVFENAGEGIIITDADQIILAVNRAFTEITGYTAEDMLGRRPKLLGSGRQDSLFYEQMWGKIHQGGRWRGEIWNVRKDGEVYPELLSISAVRNGDGHVTHYVGVFSDISVQKRSEKQLTFLAHHDPLTGLPNRALFNDRLTFGIRRATRNGAQLAVLFIDLDRFKDVNDTLGHHFGDQLLQIVSKKLQRSVRACDTLARLGGDEFTLLIEDLNGVAGAASVAEEVLHVFAQPFVLAEHELYISASIGISLYPTDGEEAHELVKNADAAMYRAKATGRSNYHFYAKEMTAYAIERLQLETMLRRSIQNNELVIYFQPQVELASGALIGAEALVRWRHPELGFILPGKFIPLAEETGFISALGEWALREACSKLKAWRAAGYKLPKVSINLSIKQLERGNMINLVEEVLAEIELPSECLEMEITESFIVKAEDAVQVVAGLRALGVQLSVDDFGTGYSSLMYLKQLPIQTIKIDKSFVMDIGRDVNNEAIIRTIITLAKNLGLLVVAEGVETAAQMSFLLREGCHYGQGYYFSKPLPEEEFIARWLARNGDFERLKVF
ncbi:MAG: EAL domain-containing protein [Candidatus Competibacteraceae bacterium]